MLARRSAVNGRIIKPPRQIEQFKSMNKPVPDYTESQAWAAAKCLRNRVRKTFDTQLFESEVRFQPHDRARKLAQEMARYTRWIIRQNLLTFSNITLSNHL